MNRLPGILFILGVSILLFWFGSKRIAFNVDILDVLPGDLPNVRALALYKENFNQRRELVLVVRHANAPVLARQVERLSGDLRDAGLASKVEWRGSLLDEPAALAETLAYLWINSPPETSAALAAGLTGENVPGRLQAALEALESGEFSGAEAMRDQYDPYGFLQHPFLKTLLKNAPQGDEFASPDGTMRLLYLTPPRQHASYREDAAWVAELLRFTGEWSNRDPERTGFTFAITGEAPYKAEVAALMEKDLGGSTLLTGAFVAFLFWLIQRNFRRLLLLVLALGLIFAATLATGALVFDKLSIMSIGFAAILMGLAADYAVLASQYQASFGGDAASLRRRIGPSIFWAATTTSSVFLVLNLSAFPGIAQLGNLVAIGILMAAAVTLFVFVPMITAGHPPPEDRRDDGLPAPWLMRHGGPATALLLLAAAVVFALRGAPGLDYRLTQMPESKIRAMGVIREIQAAVPALGEGNFPVLVAGESDAALREALARAETTINQLLKEGKLESATLPAALWPQPDNQTASAEHLAPLAERMNSLLAAAHEAGFSEEGTGLTQAVCEAWKRFGVTIRTGGIAYPESPAATALLGRFLARDDDSHVLVGNIKPAGYAEMKARDFGDLAPINQPGVYLAAWQTLQSSIKPLIFQDLRRVVAPTAVILCLMLALLFRNGRDFMLSLVYLAVMAILLCAVMALIGQQWSFQNIAAAPVLLGTGIDYAIHVILALRRYQGDRHKLWMGTGKALVFCGLTTAVGFATLTGAADPGLASFGRISAIGILAALFVSLVLLPAWWSWIQRGKSV